jgi:DNA mismatch repair protein MutL
VSFKVERDGRKVREWLAVNDRAERVQQVTAEKGLVECRGERGPLSIEAYLSGPERARQGAQGLRLFINNRPIRQRAIAASIAHAYGSVLERGRYPRGVVYIDLPPALVDINVHPQKAEVRFADPRAVTDAIHSIVSRSLAEHFSELTPARSGWHQTNDSHSLKLREPERSAIPQQSGRSDSSPIATAANSLHDTGAQLTEKLKLLRNQATSHHRSVTSGEQEPGANTRAPIAETSSASAPVSTQWSSLRFLAQVRQTYLICEGPEGICILDQHAAAERVMFGKLREQFETKQVASQSLLFPATVQLANDEIELFETHQTEIAGMGLEVRLRGRDMVSVHSVPKLLQRGSAERLLRDLLSELGRSGARGFSDAVDKALATMACHAAIRAGDVVSQDEAIALLHALDGTDFAGYCPHGRPIVAFWSFAELERRVNRR